MADHLTYEQSKKRVVVGLFLLGAVTLIEVFLSLLGKGYVIQGLEANPYVFFVVGLALIGLSLYKAYFIVYEFMHMKYEVKSLALTVLMPMLLLIWALVAFFQEGNAWKERRELIQKKNAEAPAKKENLQGYRDSDTYIDYLKG